MAKTNVNLLALKQEYKLVRAQTKKMIKECISNYELNLAKDKSNPKKLYAYVNSKVKSTTKITSLNCKNKLSTHPTTIANTLNEQFHSVFIKKPADPLQLPPFLNRTTTYLSEPDITEALVLEQLKNLDPTKSTGSDGICPYVLQKAAAAFAPILTLLFKESLNQGTFPSSWSEANVTPLHKSKSRLDPGNYRPISITSVPCKIMETLNRNSMLDYFLKYGLITPRQHGFIKNKACITNLLESNDLLTKLASTGTPTDIVFLDFAKAFDKVSHPLLIYKLTKYGICGKLLNWISAFLTNRRQRVVLGDTESDWLPVLSGVPQGSVLGPLLFIVFINDLTDDLINYASLYADDTKSICGLDPKNMQENALSLQNDINKIVDWTKTWQMELNISKCKVMHIGKKNPNTTYTMRNYSDNQPIPLITTTHERDLGIIISNDLKLAKQCAKAANTAYSIFGRLKRAFVSRSLSIWKLLYSTYIRPHLEFAISAWNPYLKKDINILERVQRRVTKIVHNIKHLNYTERCKAFGLSTLVCRRTRGDLIQMYKIVNNIDHINWHNKFTLRPPTPRHRSHYVREVIKNCEIRNKFFTNRIINSWNALSDDIVGAKTVNSFKARLDKSLRMGIP